MHVYLAGIQHSGRRYVDNGIVPPYMLSSFHYMKRDSEGGWTAGAEGWKLDYHDHPDVRGFMLDSGAFTFMESAEDHASADFDGYLDDYIDCINQYDIDLFFELDIDSVVGLGKVRELRRRLERETGKDCIPVWHRSRGKDAFERLCRNYDYVAVGGIVANEITKTDYPVFHHLIDVAHDHDTKIHGMGFTPLRGDTHYAFDSVDSKSWVAGRMAAKVYHFTGTGLESHDDDRPRIDDYRQLDRHNLREWIKYAEYMDTTYPP